MLSKNFFKKMIPAAMAGAALLVLAMPMKAMAWDNGNHWRWFHHDRDDHCYHQVYRPAYDPPYPGVRPYGYVPVYRNNPRMNYLDQEWNKAEAKHQEAVASGNRYAAKVTSQRLFNLDQDMGVAR